MEPTITNIEEKGNTLIFGVEKINVSLINAIRRTILSDIETAIFKTFPYEKNLATILF